MNYKLNANEVIEKLKILSNNNINFLDDVERLISISVEKNFIEELESLSFQAKYISGLIQVIRRRENINDEDYSLKIKDELINSYEKLKNILSKISSNFSPFIQNIFQEKYFQLTQESLKNLNLLCNDLTFLKFYFNDLKQKKDSV